MKLIMRIKKTPNIFLDICCYIYLIVMMFIFPLFVGSNFYFTLNASKFYLFCISTVILILAVILTYTVSDLASKRKLKFSVTDRCFIVFCLVGIVSSLVSEFFPQTLMGVKGRYNGAVTIFLYLSVYLILGMFSRIRKGLVPILTLSSIAVYLLGVLNSFGVYFFGANTDIDPSERGLFISTIGNRNFFSSFISITLPIIIVFLMRANSFPKKIFYSFGTVLGIMAFIAADSDSEDLAIFFMLMVLPIVAVKDKKDLLRYVEVLIIFCGSLFTYFLIFEISGGNINKLTALTQTELKASVWFFILFVAVYAVLSAKKLNGLITGNIRRIKIFVLCLFLVVIIAVVIVFIYFTFADRNSDIGALEKYFRYSDMWGDYRGSAWNYLIVAFFSFPFLRMLIGSGPDTIYQVMHKYFANDMATGRLKIFDSAHNEYLQNIITCGIVGGTFYILAVTISIYKSVKARFKSNHITAFGLSVTCYAAQAFFNISMISVAPLFIVILSLLNADLKRQKIKR